MAEISWQPTDWRDKAGEYLDMAQLAKDLTLREQFAELAARYLDMAEKIESQVVSAGILSARPNRR